MNKQVRKASRPVWCQS